MTRWFLFLLLVVAIPLGASWVANGRERPDRAAGRLLNETLALFRTRPPAPPTRDEPTPEPEPEPEPAPGPTPGPESPPGPDPKEPEPAPTPPDDPLARAREAFLAGRFAEASALFQGRDDDARALCELGSAFAAAYPAREDTRPYAVVTTRAGASFEGFLTEQPGMLTLEGFTGRSQSLPRDSLRDIRRLDLGAARERVAAQVRAAALDPDISGVRLFALVCESLAAGLPGVAAPMLDDLLLIDDREPYFLSSVRQRVPVAAQHALYRAFAACQVPHAGAEPPIRSHPGEPAVTIERGPDANTGGEIDRTNPLVGAQTTRTLDGSTGRGRVEITNERILSLMREAAPKRKRAQALYRELYAQKVTEIDTRDIDEAVSLLEDAIALYQKAQEIEDTVTVFALIQHCSRLGFQLRFLKQQADVR